VNLRLRSVGSGTTLVETLAAPVSSNGSSVIVTTPLSSVRGPLCIDVLSWNLTTTTGYSFNAQSFPITYCTVNTTEINSDVAVSLEPTSATSVVLNKTFPFIIATQNLGQRPASLVTVIITLPAQLVFVQDDSTAYTCALLLPGTVQCVLTGAMAPGRQSLGLILKGVSTSASSTIGVTISTTSSDTNASNNAFSQAVSVMSCGAALIPDTNLRAAIKIKLGISSDADLCVDDMGSLTVLSAYYSSITNLTGLEHATNLTDLVLSGNQVSDISKLAGLTNLTNLDLSGNRISNLSALAGLTNLTDLNLYYNQISDISPLASLPSLNTLYLYFNQVSDITALVSNVGFGTGDAIDISVNPLDLTEGSDDRLNIAILDSRGVTVGYGDF
jgi:Leucine-rich repeat (LRR) protein